MSRALQPFKGQFLGSFLSTSSLLPLHVNELLVICGFEGEDFVHFSFHSFSGDDYNIFTLYDNQIMDFSLQR